jgi:hypothetical protein
VGIERLRDLEGDAERNVIGVMAGDREQQGAQAHRWLLLN